EDHPHPPRPLARLEGQREPAIAAVARGVDQGLSVVHGDALHHVGDSPLLHHLAAQPGRDGPGRQGRRREGERRRGRQQRREQDPVRPPRRPCRRSMASGWLPRCYPRPHLRSSVSEAATIAGRSHRTLAASNGAWEGGAVISVFTWDESTKTPAWGGPDKLP